jgi:hypothetical protein
LAYLVVFALSIIFPLISLKLHYRFIASIWIFLGCFWQLKAVDDFSLTLSMLGIKWVFFPQELEVTVIIDIFFYLQILLLAWKEQRDRERVTL